MITAESITDEQIRELRRSAEQPGSRNVDVAATANRALGTGTAWKPFGLDREAARARCAEILNERAARERTCGKRVLADLPMHVHCARKHGHKGNCRGDNRT